MPDPNVKWTGSSQWHQFANAFTVSTTRTLAVPPTALTDRTVVLFAFMATTTFGIGGITARHLFDANNVDRVTFPVAQSFNGICEGELIVAPNWPAALGGTISIDTLVTNGAQAGVILGTLVSSSAVSAVVYNAAALGSGSGATGTLNVRLLGTPLPYLLAAGCAGLNTSSSGGPTLTTPPASLDPNWPVAVGATFDEPRSVFGDFFVSGALSTYIGDISTFGTTVTPSWDLGVSTPWATASFGPVVRDLSVILGRPFVAVL